jgi:hypothetical protein
MEWQAGDPGRSIQASTLTLPFEKPLSYSYVNQTQAGHCCTPIRVLEVNGEAPATT